MLKDKKNKGITLVVLIVTIIVLLILASISIAVIKKSNLLDKTKLAKGKYENAKNNEITILGGYENQIEISNYRETNGEVKNKICLDEQEREIGTFFGNKLYQKTIKLNYTTADKQTYPHNIKDVDIIYIDAGNTFFTSQTPGNGASSAPYFSSGFNNGGAVNGYGKIIQDVDKEVIYIRGSAGAGSGVAYVTLKYTKK